MGVTKEQAKKIQQYLTEKYGLKLWFDGSTLSGDGNSWGVNVFVTRMPLFGRRIPNYIGECPIWTEKVEN